MEKAKILIVEDELLIGIDIKDILLELGYEVCEIVTTGEAAITMAIELKPNLVIMDILLAGEMDGIEAARHILKELDIPVVYMTAHTDKMTFRRARETEPYGYLVKPSGKSDIFTTLETALHRHKLEARLRDSERRYKSLFERSFDCVYVHDFEGDFIDANNASLELLGYTEADIKSLNYASLLVEEDLPLALETLEELVRTGTHKRTLELRIKKKDGGIIWIETRGSVIYKKETPCAIQGIAREITGRKEAECQVTASLRDREVLLREIHNRVDGNMQLISDFLSLQMTTITDKQNLDVFRKSLNRIRSMAFIHKMLYRSEDFERVNFDNFIDELVLYLLQSYNIQPSDINFEKSISGIRLSIEKAIPCALIINELVSNSLKHAFRDRGKGTISIKIHATGTKSFELSIGDNGIGIPDDINFKKSIASGFTFVNALIRQIHGSIQLSREKGSSFIIMVDDEMMLT